MRFGWGMILLCAASVSHATVMLPLDTEQLVGRAHTVVLGTVETQTAHWTPDHDLIYTEVVVRASRVYKGGAKPGDRIVVRREGGSVDGIGMRVFGAAQFSVGEEVVIFVENRGAAAYVVGMAQGKWRVSTEPSGRKMVTPNLGEVALLKPAAHPQAVRPLEEAEAAILAEVKRGKAAKGAR